MVLGIESWALLMPGYCSATELHPSPHQASDQPPYQGLGPLLSNQTKRCMAWRPFCAPWAGDDSVASALDRQVFRTTQDPAAPSPAALSQVPRHPGRGFRSELSPHALVQLGNGSAAGGRGLDDAITVGRLQSDLVASCLSSWSRVRYGSPEGQSP